MKLKNKLLPFVGIAALGATFAPIALTSCKSNSSSSAIDLKDWYTPTIEKHAYATLTEDEVANLYFCGDETAEWGDWLDEDEMIERLTQDYLFGSSMYVQYLQYGTHDLSGTKLKAKTGNMLQKQAEQVYFDLTGLNDIVGMEVNTPIYFGDLTVSTQPTYDKYDISVSDVRIGHMTNYFGSTTGVEYPTISFELEFDVEYLGNTKSSSGVAGLIDKNGYVYNYGSSTTTQNHKGTLSVVNVPIKVEYVSCEEISNAYAWRLSFDMDTILETELSTRVPFSISATDNVSYTTTAELDSRTQQYSGTKTYSYDYYSNMPWENQVSSDLLTYATEQAAKKAEEGTTLYNYIKKYVLLTGREYTEDFLAGTKYYSSALDNTISYANEQFFNTISYYLLSVACK